MFLGVGSVVVVGLLAAAAALAWGLVRFNSIPRVGVDLAAAGSTSPQNFLVVGSDTRNIKDDGPDNGAIFGSGKDAEPAGQRADSMMIVRVNPGPGPGARMRLVYPDPLMRSAAVSAWPGGTQRSPRPLWMASGMPSQGSTQ